MCKNKVQGNYYLPGGHVEFGDTLEKTIYKEMNEELGLKKGDITGIFYKNYLEQTYIRDGADHHELNMIFSIKIPNDFEIHSQEDYIAFEWIDIKDIGNIRLLPEKIKVFLIN